MLSAFGEDPNAELMDSTRAESFLEDLNHRRTGR